MVPIYFSNTYFRHMMKLVPNYGKSNKNNSGKFFIFVFFKRNELCEGCGSDQLLFLDE